MIEVEGLDDLIADFSRAPLEANVKARAVVEKGALNIKNDAVQTIAGTRYAPHYPRSISYDITGLGFGEIKAEIGPDKGRPQGALGNILEYGTVNNAPKPHLRPALDREAPRFEKAMADLIDEVL